MQFFWYTKDSSVNDRWYSGASEEQSCYTYKKSVTQQEKNEIFLFPYPIPPSNYLFNLFLEGKKKVKTYARVMIYKYTAIFSPQCLQGFPVYHLEQK